MNLYAQWTGNNYTIVFNANEGTGTMANQSMIYGQATNLSANTFTRSGYAFIGWNTMANGSGTSYVDKANVGNLATQGQITLYAQWNANRYRVTFDPGTGAMVNPTSIEVTQGGMYGELPTPSLS